jgi:hypothetical protein
MSIRPQDLPELRVEIVNRHRSRKSLVKWEELIIQGHRDWMDILIGRKPQRSDGATMQAYERMRVADAELYFVSPEMTELAVAAGRSLPDFNIESEDMPGPTGLIIFGAPLDAGLFDVSLSSPNFAADGHTVGISAIAWSVMPHGAAIWLSFYATRQSIIDSLPPDIVNDLPAGQRLIYLFGTEAAWELHLGDREVTTAPHVDLAGRALRASWLLMQQPLAKVSSTEPDRAARKRLRRAGHEPAPVRVIELRRPKAPAGHGDSDREYHHQWIVRGHWRQHWHPKRQVHRPVWIAPHIKGPEGAPLIGGEKVYALKH